MQLNSIIESDHQTRAESRLDYLVKIILGDMLKFGKSKLSVISESNEFAYEFIGKWNLTLLECLNDAKYELHKIRIKELVDNQVKSGLHSKADYIVNLDLLIAADGSPITKNL